MVEEHVSEDILIIISCQNTFIITPIVLIIRKGKVSGK